MTRSNIIALLLAIIGFIASAFITHRIFDAIPHLEDEIAYVWQAEVISKGQISIPSPPEPRSFLVPFVIDHEGQRFGKYPLGWPAVLALGVLLDARWLVNPLLAGLAVWLTYLLGRHVFGEIVGLLAAGLTITSPFFLLNSASLLSHPLGLVLTAGFVLAWLYGFGQRTAPRRWSSTLLIAFLMGALILTRPFTAVGVAIPFALHGAYLLFWGGEDRHSLLQTRLHLVSMAVLILALASLHFAWQYYVTGDPLLNPYTLWWPYDKVGFGPGYGVSEQGHNLHIAWINTKHSLASGYRDLFGWGEYSWIFLPFGLIAALRKPKALMLGSIFPILVIFYMAYWVGSSLFGPRYYYEGLFSLTIFSAAGIAFLAGFSLTPHRTGTQEDGPAASKPASAEVPGTNNDLSVQGLISFPATMQRARATYGWLRPWLVLGFLAALVGYNLFIYTPPRLNEMHGLYGISRENYLPFFTPQAQELAPALFIVHTHKWMAYGALIDLEDPWLTTPFIFAWGRGPRTDAALEVLFSDRTVYHYYPEDEPFVFYEERKE